MFVFLRKRNRNIVSELCMVCCWRIIESGVLYVRPRKQRLSANRKISFSPHFQRKYLTNPVKSNHFVRGLFLFSLSQELSLRQFPTNFYRSLLVYLFLFLIVFFFLSCLKPRHIIPFMISNWRPQKF